MGGQRTKAFLIFMAYRLIVPLACPRRPLARIRRLLVSHPAVTVAALSMASARCARVLAGLMDGYGQ